MLAHTGEAYSVVMHCYPTECCTNKSLSSYMSANKKQRCTALLTLLLSQHGSSSCCLGMGFRLCLGLALCLGLEMPTQQ